jgi:hypothetical protein
MVFRVKKKHWIFLMPKVRTTRSSNFAKEGQRLNLRVFYFIVENPPKERGKYDEQIF